MTRVVFMGTPEFAVPSLALLLDNYDVVGVLTRPDQPAGRGRRLEESPVKQLARAYGAEVQQPASLRSDEAQAALASLEPELIVVAAYGLLLPEVVLDMPHFGCINVHGSLLPRHRGAAPIAAAILAGDDEAGVSIMLMEAGLDSGPVLSQASLPIGADDTTSTLTRKLADLGADLLLSTLPRWLAGGIEPKPQDDGLATYAPRLTKEAGQIDWSQPAEHIQRQVRAFQPWPSAYTTWNGQRLKVVRASVESSPNVNAEPGEVVGESGRAAVATGDDFLQLHEVQLAGKRILNIDAFLRGAPSFIGSRLPS